MRLVGPLSEVLLRGLASLGALPALSLAMACVLSTKFRGRESGDSADTDLLSKYARVWRTDSSVSGGTRVLYTGDGRSNGVGGGELADGVRGSWRLVDSLVSGTGELFEVEARPDNG